MNQMQPDEHAEQMACAIEMSVPVFKKMIDAFPYSVQIEIMRDHVAMLELCATQWRKRK